MSLYDDFIKYSIKILQQKIFDEQKNRETSRKY